MDQGDIIMRKCTIVLGACLLLSFGCSDSKDNTPKDGKDAQSSTDSGTLTDKGLDAKPGEDAKQSSDLKADGKSAPDAAPPVKGTKIIYLHHSTGEIIWNGGVKSGLDKYNSDNNKEYAISEKWYPDQNYERGDSENYPYDYWNIWVNHQGNAAYTGQETLELLIKKYNVIVFKHCYPVSEMVEGGTSVSSDQKTMGNYKAQYNALKAKMLKFPTTKFIVWTGAVHRQESISQEQAQWTQQFFTWVKGTWDQKNDNIFLWDFYALETEGGLYLKPEYDEGDSHPTPAFGQKVAPYFVKRLVDVIEGRGDTGSLTGK
jgi:hypothetical protein